MNELSTFVKRPKEDGPRSSGLKVLKSQKPPADIKRPIPSQFSKTSLDRYNILTEKFRTTDERLKSELKQLSNKLSNQKPILILGESRVGKTWLAKAIHIATRKEDHDYEKFRNLSLASISDELLSSELFGHSKGSFTGAIIDKNGFFEQAENGTILLDDIDTCSTRMQAALLKVIDEKIYQKVGDPKIKKIGDVRIIFVTNQNLQSLVRDGRFRSDLYNRLISGNSISISPLRMRPGDIPMYAQLFLKELWQEDSPQITFNNEGLKSLSRLNIGCENLAEVQRLVNKFYYDSIFRGLDYVEVHESSKSEILEQPFNGLSDLESLLAERLKKWDYNKNGDFITNLINPVVAKVAKDTLPITSKNASKIIGLGNDKKSKDGVTKFQASLNAYPLLLKKLNTYNF